MAPTQNSRQVRHCVTNITKAQTSSNTLFSTFAACPDEEKQVFDARLTLLRIYWKVSPERWPDTIEKEQILETLCPIDPNFFKTLVSRCYARLKEDAKKGGIALLAACADL